MTADSAKIQRCEIEYMKCFSQVSETRNFIRLRDDLLKDMYYHNFTLIKHSRTEDELYQLIEDEISLRKIEGADFCNIVSYAPINDSLIQKFKIKPEIKVNGFYLFDPSKFSELRSREDCIISELNDVKMITDAISVDLELNEDSYGTDFCTRRA